ncbi:MAG: polyhydroxyalkanoate synthesis repressor PhaR [Burkholderiaceae bacterium]
MPNGGKATRLIKKYPNRRLYDTQTSAYITLADVRQLVLANEDFRVVDAKSSEDLTRSILLQIILEAEAGGTPLFSSSTLAQIIRFYGHAMQGMMGAYLEKNLQAFVEIQNRLQDQSKGLYDSKGIPNPDLWAQFMSVQAPMMQAMLGNYIDQSKNLFVQMQEQMQAQTRSMFQNFPFHAQGGGQRPEAGPARPAESGSGAATEARAGTAPDDEPPDK